MVAAIDEIGRGEMAIENVPFVAGAGGLGDAIAPQPPPIEIGLHAAIVAVAEQQPLILVVSPGGGEPDNLPFGPFDPLAHRTFETGLRAWVAEQTALKLGYVEQLYTFGDRGRHTVPGDTGPHLVSVGYLALTRISDNSPEELALARAHWRRWYAFFPWEDWREGRPAVLDEAILPALSRWSRTEPSSGPAERRPLGRRERMRLAFGDDGAPLGRGTRARPLRAALRGRAGGRGRTRRPPHLDRARHPRSPAACRCASTTAASSPPPSRGCAPS